MRHPKHPKTQQVPAIEYYLLSVGYWIFTEIANNQYPTRNIQKTQQIPLLNITH